MHAHSMPDEHPVEFKLLGAVGALELLLVSVLYQTVFTKIAFAIERSSTYLRMEADPQVSTDYRILAQTHTETCMA